jgi:hypothetical protein
VQAIFGEKKPMPPAASTNTHKTETPERATNVLLQSSSYNALSIEEAIMSSQVTSHNVFFN